MLRYLVGRVAWARVLLFACLAIAVFNLAIDLLYAIVDPRVRRPA